MREGGRDGYICTSMYMHKVENTGVYWVHPVYCYPMGVLCDIADGQGVFKEIDLPRRVIPLGPDSPR